MDNQTKAVTGEGNALRTIADWQDNSMRLSHQVMEQTAKLQACESQRDELLSALKVAYVDLTLLHIGDSGEWKNSFKAERMRAAIANAEGGAQ